MGGVAHAAGRRAKQAGRFGPVWSGVHHPNVSNSAALAQVGSCFPAMPRASGSLALTALCAALTLHFTAAVTAVSPSPTPVMFPATAVWRYLDTGVNLGSAWRNASFDDSSWSNGSAPLGFGFTGYQSTVLSSAAAATTYYFRRNLTGVANLVSATKVWTLSLVVNDGAVVYINGKELHRENMPNTTIGYKTVASSGKSTSVLSETVNNFSTCAVWLFFCVGWGFHGGLSWRCVRVPSVSPPLLLQRSTPSAS